MRRANSRRGAAIELIGAILLIGGLLAFATSASLRQQREREALGANTPYSVRSAADLGLYGLEAWLDRLGYRTARLEGARYDLDSQNAVLFIMPPSVGFSDADVAAIEQWLRDGGTLIYAHSDAAPKLNAMLGVTAGEIQFSEDATMTEPVNGLRVGEKVPVKARKRVIVEPEAPEGAPVTVHLAAGFELSPVLVSFPKDAGRVFVTTAPYLFTNDSLRELGAGARLTRAMMGAAAPARVAFDEYHLGFDSASAVTGQTLLATLYDTPWGWALIYMVILSLVTLALNGRRFGRSVPLPAEIARRSPAEYVVSMAQLFQRGGKRAAMLKHYRLRLKRALGAPAGVDANLPDAEFVQALARARDDLNSARLIDTLRDFNRAHVDEATLLRLARASTQPEIFKLTPVEAR